MTHGTGGTFPSSLHRCPSQGARPYAVMIGHVRLFPGLFYIITEMTKLSTICDKIYGLKVGLHCFKELQFIGQSETMGEKNIVCLSAMAADKECVVVTTTAKSLIGQLAPGRSKQGLREYSHWSTGLQAVWQGKLVHNRTNRFY